MEEKDLELIERYLAGELTEGETKEVQRRREDDPEFAQALRIWGELGPALERKSAEAFRQQLASAMAEVDREAQKIRRPVWIYAIAAGLAILVSLALYVGSGNTDSRYQELYASHFSPPPSPFVLRNDQKLDSLLLAGNQAYEVGGYIEAARLWAELDVAHPLGEQVSLYRGISLLAGGRSQEATKVLLPLTEKKDPGLRLSAQWYLALAFLRQEKGIEAQQLLRELTQEDSNYTPKAQKLLEAMEE